MLEALMQGTPVLAYNNASIPEVINENYLGFVAPQGEWEKLAEELLRRLKKKENAKKIRKYFKRKCLFKYSEKKLNDLFQKVVNEKT